MNKLISKNKTSRAWLLISCDNRQYAGNLGYDDEIAKKYVYDNKTPNSKQVTEGDLVLLRDKDQLLGVARIELIKNTPIAKELQYCPLCSRRLSNKKRKNAKFLYLCSNTECKHQFDEPFVQTKDRTEFTAYYSNTFVATKGAIDLKILQKACQNLNKQHSISSIDLEQIQSILLENAPNTAKLFNDNNTFQYIQSNEASEYTISSEDRREIVFRQIKERRGQSEFRDLLRQRYGNQCMITGLKLLDVLEAAHILPYRGTDDNHPDNGLLLRADLHTLFDLNLLGINPESLEVKFHPKVLRTDYQELEGRKLIYSQYKPSYLALQHRWKEFLDLITDEEEIELPTETIELIEGWNKHSIEVSEILLQIARKK